MNPKRTCFTIAATIGLLSTSTQYLAAQSTNPAAQTEKPKIEAKFFNQTTPFAGEITRGIIVAETNQFSFVVPTGFRNKFDAAA